MKYEVKLVKQGFFGQDKIDIKKLSAVTDLPFGLFDEYGVLEKNKCTEDFAFFYKADGCSKGVFFKSGINKESGTGEVVLTINERFIYYKELESPSSSCLKILVNGVKRFFRTAEISESIDGKDVTLKDGSENLFFESEEFRKIYDEESREFYNSTTTGMIKGPLHPLFLDDWNNGGAYRAVLQSVEQDWDYEKHDFFEAEDGTKKVRFTLSEKKYAIMPLDARTVRDICGRTPVICVLGKDLPYDMVIDEIEKISKIEKYDARQFVHARFSNVQLKRIVKSVENRLASEQFPDFNFKLVVFSSILNKNPSFLSDYEWKCNFTLVEKKDGFTMVRWTKFFTELVFTKKDLEKVTHLCFDRTNEFFLKLLPDWNCDDSAFDIESLKGIELLPNLATYSYDGLIFSDSLLSELESFEEADEDTDETDYSIQEDEEEEDFDEDEDSDEYEDDESDEEDENSEYEDDDSDEDSEYEENSDDDDVNDEEESESEISTSTDSSFENAKRYLDLSASDEEKAFVKELVIKNCKEYDEADNLKNNRIGVIILYLNGYYISQNQNLETRKNTFFWILKSDYVKQAWEGSKFVNDAIEANDEYKKMYHIFDEANGDDEDDDEEESFYNKEDSLKILELVEKQTEIQSVEIDIHATKEPLPLTVSKFGGYPYWSKNMEYPTSKADGEKLILLAQINFAEVPHLEDFPEKGILQFFIKNNDDYGCGFDSDQQWEIVFHENIEEPMTEDELRALGVKAASEIDKDECYLPLNSEFALSFEETVHSIGSACDEYFDKAVEKAAKELNLPLPEGNFSAYNALNSEVYESFFDEYQVGHRISGYPFFTQSDPRSADSGYDVLLLQIDTDEDGGHEIMWGDSGIANFFIKREDLKKRDFSKVFYTWDCC